MSDQKKCSCKATNAAKPPYRKTVLSHQDCDEGRRRFLKAAGTLALTSPLLPSPFTQSIDNTGHLNSKEILRNKAVANGKATVLTILHTADIHGQLMTHDEFFIENGQPVYKKRGGYATLKTMIETLRMENPANTLLIDGGDCFQGSGVAAFSKGRALIPLMNHLQYDVVLPGNWEVLYGKQIMMDDMTGYTAAKVCANMYHDGLSDAGNLIFPPYFVTTVGNVKIGFIVYNDPLTPVRQSPAFSKGIRFTHPDENVEGYITTLRKKLKCDLVILLTHMGLAQQVALADQSYIKGADYILGADTHERVREPLKGEYAFVTEPGAFGSFISKFDIVVERGRIKEHAYQLLDVDPERYGEDEAMKALVTQVREPYRDRIDRVIGTTKVPLVRYYIMETPLDNFLTDAIMWKFNSDIVLSNGFRFCPPLVPNPDTGLAEISVDYLWSMLPDESEAKHGLITGKQLWDYLENELENAFASNPAKRFGGWLVRFKGMEINFTIKNEKGKRVNWIKVKGAPLKMEAKYSVVACERDGDPDTTICRLEDVIAPRRLGITLHAIIEEYLAVHSPISPELEGRATATDAPSTLLTQLIDVGYEFR